jgi:hypothetical protein
VGSSVSDLPGVRAVAVSLHDGVCTQRAGLAQDGLLREKRKVLSGRKPVGDRIEMSGDVSRNDSICGFFRI